MGLGGAENQSSGGASAVFAKTGEPVLLSNAGLTDITGLTVTVEEGFYQCNVLILGDVSSLSTGEINTGGTAEFEANLVCDQLSAEGVISDSSRPATFTTTGLNEPLAAGQLLRFNGVIKVTVAGTIILQGSSINAPDALIILENSTISLTKIGA